MKINKDEYIKQCWTYINATLKYLKEMSGNLYIAARKADFKDVSDKLVGLGALEALDLKEGEYYSILRHTDEKMLGRYMGLHTTEDSYQLRFEVASATDTIIFYRDVSDIFDVYATDLNDEYVKFEHKILGDDDWPLYAGNPFKGKLLEKILKGKGYVHQNS
jgi:hypothetical protein